ncbi:MAG: AsmA family protein [Verrucomicrobia bacterium]|nr:MAG: AsmA family protein [Verrucomicrobiota bacterium]
MKRFLKIGGGLFLLLVVLVVGVVLARDGIVKYAAQKIVAGKTGFGLTLQGLHIALLQPGLEINDLKLTNPADFPEPGALEIKKLKVSLDRAGTTAQEIRLREVTLDLPSVIVVKKINGEINFKRLAGQDHETPPAQPGAPAPQQPPAPSEQKPAKKLLIDHLAIRLGTIYVRTYVEGEGQPREQKYVMNINREFTDVTKAKLVGIGTQLFLEAVLKSSPDALLNLGGGVLNTGKDLGGAAGGGVKQVGGTVQDVGQPLGKALKGLFDAGKK